MMRYKIGRKKLSHSTKKHKVYVLFFTQNYTFENILFIFEPETFRTCLHSITVVFLAHSICTWNFNFEHQSTVEMFLNKVVE